MKKRSGMSLMELLATVSILGALAAVSLVSVGGVAKRCSHEACFVNQAEIELQAALWRRSTGGYPATDLSDIGADTKHFPEGAPVCPVDGTTYTIDKDGRIVGHRHE